MNLPTNRRGLVFNADPFKNLTVGFDSLFDQLSSLSDFEAPSYPPYNVIQDGDDFVIEIALAGIDKKDLNVEIQENTLTVSYQSSEEDTDKKLYKGIAQRSFKRQFNLSEDIEIEGAHFKNGMLNIFLKRIIPEEKKPKKIKIK